MLFNELLVTTTVKLLDANRVPALMGEPGIGKSSFVEDVARRTNTRCFTLPCNLLADNGCTSCSGREDGGVVSEVLPTLCNLPGNRIRQGESK